MKDAEQVLRDALAAAAAQDKQVLLYVVAPWCPWCRRFERYMGLADVAEALGRDFVPVKIDTEAMPEGAALHERLRGHGGGIPWYAVLDNAGTKRISSEGPNGNIGFPTEEEEIAHFKAIFRGTARRISPTDVDTLVERFDGAGPE